MLQGISGREEVKQGGDRAYREVLTETVTFEQKLGRR